MKSYIFTIIPMIVSLIGVFLSLGKGVSLRCGCLGSFFHVPLSYVTVSENIVDIGAGAIENWTWTFAKQDRTHPSNSG